MKLMSFNTQHCLNYITRQIDFEVMAKAILACEADVVGLNEMRGAGSSAEYEEQVERLAALTGMPYFYFAKAIDCPGGGPYGNGLLSKYPIKETEIIPIPNPETKTEGNYYEPRVILHATVDIEGRDVEFFVTHVGLAAEEKELAIKTLMPFVSITDNPVIVMGDFNMTSDDPIMKPLMNTLQDTFEVYPDKTVFTWPCKAEMFPKYPPSTHQKLDFIFVSHHFKVESVEIPELILSDHKPYIAYLDLLDEAKG